MGEITDVLKASKRLVTWKHGVFSAIDDSRGFDHTDEARRLFNELIDAVTTMNGGTLPPEWESDPEAEMIV